MLIFCLIFDQFQSGVAHKSNTYKKACHQPYSGISRTLSNPGTFRTLVYIQNSGTFRTRGKCRTLAYSEPYQVSTIEFLRKYLKAIVLQIRIIFAISAFQILFFIQKYLFYLKVQWYRGMGAGNFDIPTLCCNFLS